MQLTLKSTSVISVKYLACSLCISICMAGALIGCEHESEKSVQISTQTRNLATVPAKPCTVNEVEGNEQVDKSVMKKEWKNTLFNRIGVAPVDGGLQMDDYWVWGSSVIKGDDGLFHMYASRWPKSLIFHPGWVVASEIVHAISETAQGPYKFSDVAMGARGAQYFDGRAVHNPRVIKHKDLYVMFYMGSTHPFEDINTQESITFKSPVVMVAFANKRIGIATSKSPYGPWERRDEPVLPTKPDTFYSYHTSNPAPWINEDGSVDLIFKARSYTDKDNMVIGIAKAPSIDGPFEVITDEPIFSKKKFGVIEDPFIWKDESGYHMLAKDQHGDITGHKHSGVLAHSIDAVHWELDKEPLAYTKEVEWSDGNTIKMGKLDRPFGLVQEGKLTHLFFASMDGPGGFNQATKSWNMVLPLKN
ncbi:MAG: glycoside hydrolase family protein [Colwellia sp.]